MEASNSYVKSWSILILSVTSLTLAGVASITIAWRFAGTREGVVAYGNVLFTLKEGRIDGITGMHDGRSAAAVGPATGQEFAVYFEGMPFRMADIRRDNAADLIATVGFNAMPPAWNPSTKNRIESNRMLVPFPSTKARNLAYC